MQTVNELTAAEVEPNRWITEASMLRLAPGQWPRQLPTALGNKEPFHFIHRHSDNSVFDYQQPKTGIILTVLND